MGLRFRKYLKLAPGLRMNITGSGISWTLGPRGASVGIGKRGAYLNTGIPGSGLYTRQRISGETSPSKPHSTKHFITKTITVEVKEDGKLYFLDENKNVIPDKLIEIAKKQQGEAIRKIIQKKCNEINEQIEDIGKIHLHTPNCKERPKFFPSKFDEIQPEAPKPKPLTFIAKIFSYRRKGIEQENAAADSRFRNDHAEWKQRLAEFEKNQADQKKFIEEDIYKDTVAMERFLEENLHDIVWPRETDVSFEVLQGGKKVVFDVEMPKLEDMPNKTAEVPLHWYKLSVKKMTEVKVRTLYMDHVHGVGFRIIGETFAALPLAEEVILSAFTKRPDPSTANIQNEYLYSVRVKRGDWEQINFNKLADIDITESLTRYELRRNMSKTGVFKPIEPL